MTPGEALLTPPGVAIRNHNVSTTRKGLKAVWGGQILVGWRWVNNSAVFLFAPKTGTWSDGCLCPVPFDAARCRYDAEKNTWHVKGA